MKQIVHVAQDAIRANAKDGGYRPPIIVRDYRGSSRAHEITLRNTINNQVLGRFVYRAQDPLSCGARLWAEFDSDVVRVEISE